MYHDQVVMASLLHTPPTLNNFQTKNTKMQYLHKHVVYAFLELVIKNSKLNSVKS